MMLQPTAIQKLNRRTSVARSLAHSRKDLGREERAADRDCNFPTFLGRPAGRPSCSYFLPSFLLPSSLAPSQTTKRGAAVAAVAKREEIADCIN